MKILWKSKIVVFGFLFMATHTALAEVKLPAIFSSHMVLQRDIELPVWGWADSGETITVSIGENKAKAVADSNGEWKVKLQPEKAGGPVQLVVTGKNNTITFEDVLIGEVWVCSGQSNMEMGLCLIANSQKEVEDANHPSIRLFQVRHAASGVPLDDFLTDNAKLQTWRLCNSKTVTEGGCCGFSSTAYFFGRELNKKLGVPVGLINDSWGGTQIKPWIPAAGFKMSPKFDADVKEIERWNLEYVKAVPAALSDMNEWFKYAQKTVAQGGILAPPKWPIHALSNETLITGLYNGMINPLVPFAIRGAIWYQGENNCGEGINYYYSMRALIGGWRAVWGQGDFPFYYAQLAPFRYKAGENLPLIWQAQLSSLKVANTGMVVNTDLVDNVDDIHPRNKQEVGRRFALWALANTYGQKDLVFSGPLYKNIQIEGEKARIYFDYTGSGLTTRDGNDLNYFEIAGSDGKFVKAKAVIDANTVIVSSPEVKTPSAVRFGWDEIANPNLINKEGLPASPFNTNVNALIAD
jgi:sialate O-acetylesterase